GGQAVEPDTADGGCCAQSDPGRGQRDDRRCRRGNRGSRVGDGASAAVGRSVAGDDGAGDAANRADAVEFDAGDAGSGGDMDAADVRGLPRYQDGVRRIGQRCRTGYVDRGRSALSRASWLPGRGTATVYWMSRQCAASRRAELAGESGLDDVPDCAGGADGY